MRKLSHDEIAKFLDDKWQNKICNMCGNNKWIILTKIFEIQECENHDNEIEDKDIIPIIPIICSNCGNTIFINPIVLGIMSNK